MTMTAPADPFGLWQAVEIPGAESFSLPGEAGGSAPEEAPALLWTVDLSAGPGELARRAAQVAAVEAGLADSARRLDALLAARGGQAQHFSAAPAADPLPGPAEARLDAYLTRLELSQPPDEVSFGLREVVSGAVDRLRGRSPAAEDARDGVPWGPLQARFNVLLASLEQQALHFAWVETCSGGSLLARSAVRWGGDMDTIWQPGLPPELVAAHQQSLRLAAASRAANMRAFLTVTRLAGSIMAAAATPLAPIQALSLAWQFVSEVVIPLVEKSNQKLSVQAG
jgi:hypothetical protein